MTKFIEILISKFKNTVSTVPKPFMQRSDLFLRLDLGDR